MVRSWKLREGKDGREDTEGKERGRTHFWIEGRDGGGKERLKRSSQKNEELEGGGEGKDVLEDTEGKER